VRIAILADIHGNYPALEAALKDVAGQGVDRIVVAGDVVMGAPDSDLCWQRVKALSCPILRGNHERYVFDLHTERAPPEWHTRQFGPVQYAAAKLGAAALEEMRMLPTLLRLPEAPGVVFVHASARNDTDLVFPYTPDVEIHPMFAGCDEQLVIRGHNHFCGVRLVGEKKIVTVGSVGLPLDGTPSAQYALIERRSGDWRVEHRCVRYDTRAAAARFEQTGYLDEAGPMARIYQREVVTASFHILPFLAYWKRRQAEEPTLSLDAAVDTFLGSARL
jgi:predicted phosphodiesterase